MAKSREMFPMSELKAHSADAAGLLKLLANEHRLLVLCHLLAYGELSVNELAERVGLSQSALSQHLAKLRAHGIVNFERKAQTLFYAIRDARVERMIAVLKDIFCPTLGSKSKGRT